ncbi:putative endonuclease/exonuclease/phosphatase family protein, partial [Rhizoctonia solani 123E]
MLWRSISFLAAVSLCSAATVNSTEQAEVISGTFNVLSLSVNGLPTDFFAGYDGKKTEKTKLMALAMAKYDYGIINIQNDFYFHDTLCEYDNHPFRTESSGSYLLSGSGLSTFSKYSWIDFSRAYWNVCGVNSGYGCFVLK